MATHRLPVPGSDIGTWGTVLNDFLSQSINTDGTLIPDAVTAAGAAPKASPALTGTPTAPTAPAGTNTTQLATTAFVIANAVSGGTGISQSAGDARYVQKGALVINVKDYGATGNGTTDDRPAILNAIGALPASGGTLLFPAGTYYVSTFLQFNTKTFCDVSGYGAKIVSNDNTSEVIQIYNCTRFSLRGLDISHKSTSVGRTGGGDGIRIGAADGGNGYVYGAYGGTDIEIADCHIHDVTAAGIINYGGHKVRIHDNIVENTLADGIHTTDGASDCTTHGNVIINSGDDSIPCVSYSRTANPVTRIATTGNTILNSQARGIVAVGGKEIVAVGNVIDGTRASGLFVGTEYDAYTSQNVQDIIYANNIVNNTGNQPNYSDDAAIEVDATGFTNTLTITGVLIHANTVRYPRFDAVRIANNATSGVMNDISVKANQLYGPTTTSGRAGIMVNVGRNNIIEGNKISGFTGGGVIVNGAAGLTIVTNNDTISVGGTAYSGGTQSNNRSY